MPIIKLACNQYYFTKCDTKTSSAWQPITRFMLNLFEYRFRVYHPLNKNNYLGNKRTGFVIGRTTYVNKRTSVGNGRTSIGNERRDFVIARTTYVNKRTSVGNGRTSIGNERRSFVIARTTYVNKRTSVGNVFPPIIQVYNLCQPSIWFAANTTLLNALPKQARHDKLPAWFVVYSCQSVGYL